jgi:hypothetical protein
LSIKVRAFKIMVFILAIIAFGFIIQGSAQAEFNGSVGLQITGPLSQHGIFIQGQTPPKALVDVFNQGEEQTLVIDLAVYDHNVQPVMDIEVSHSVLPGTSQIEIPLDSLPVGWYRLIYRIYSAHNLIYALDGGQKDFVILPAESLSYDIPSPFGLENSKLTLYEAQIIKAVGAEWLKGPFVPTWADTQFAPGGSLIFRNRLEERGLAKQSELKQQAMVGQIPEWAKVSGTFFSKEYLKDYARYLQGLIDLDLIAEAISVRAPYTENALNSQEVNDLALQLKLTKYLLAEAYKDVLVNLELTGFDYSLVSALLKAGAGENIDALLIHLDPMDDVTEIDLAGHMAEMEKIFASYGLIVPIWTVTPNSVGYERSLDLFATSTVGPGKDEIKQAQYLIKSHLIQLSEGVERIFATPFSSDEGARRLFTGGSGAYPDTPQRPRVALAAYAVMTDLLNGYTYLGRLKMTDRSEGAVFVKDGQTWLVAWNDFGKANLELNADSAEVCVLDYLGKQMMFIPDKNKLWLSLSESPIYIKGLGRQLITQVVLDDYIPRLDSWVNEYPFIKEELKNLAHHLNLFITELWMISSINQDVLYGQSTPFPGGWPVDNPQDENISKQNLLSYWSTCVESVIDALYKLQAQPDFYNGPQKALLFKLLDQLTALCQLAGFLDTPWGLDEHRLYINDTKEFLAVTIETLNESPASDQHIALPLTESLIQQCLLWQEMARGATDSLAAALAVVIREVAAFTVLQSEKEPGYDYTLALQSPSIQLIRPEIGFNPPGFDPVDQTFWTDSRPSPTRLLRENPRPTWRLGEEEYLPYNTGSVQNWDELPIRLDLYNFGSTKDVFFTLQAPEGWLWQVNGHIFRHDAVLSDWPIRLTGSGSLSPHEMIISLFIPWETPSGEYTVRVGLNSYLAASDAIRFDVVLP